MGKKDREESAKQKLVGAWTGFLSTTVIFLLLGYFLFNWAWFVFFVIGATFIGAVTTTINYYATDTTKCAVCGARLDKNAQFCRVCGNQALKNCPHCGAKLKSSSRFCEACGKNIYEVSPAPSQSGSKSTIAPTAAPVEERFFYCPACGTKVAAGTNLCPACGMNLK